MSQPHEPTPGTDPAGTEQGGAGQIGGPGDTTGHTEPLPRAAGAQPPTEPEPAPSAAPEPTQPYEAQPTTDPGQPDQPTQPAAAAVAGTATGTTAAFGAEPPPGPGDEAGHNAIPPAGEPGANAMPAGEPGPYAMPPQGGPAGHYVFVPAGATVRTRRFGPAFGRFARNRATQLVAAVVVGAVIGGGTVAIVDNATQHNQPTRTVFRPGGPFNNGGPHFGQGFGQGPNQGFRN